ncbi:hypothetical protein DV515_00007511 [Chloebia gouldiae]|uniref:Uncharacterized protein n=1 Tax=Chloebia gouldiae TaxID=44316 RepID=A0A3L8SGX9_CHLGU|nr:hypothetical protein DV515_00007511 [Chloebia gouldiae]
MVQSSPVRIIATSKSLHSYARPPPGSSNNDPNFSKNDVDETAVRHERLRFYPDGLLCSVCAQQHGSPASRFALLKTDIKKMHKQQTPFQVETNRAPGTWLFLF